VVLKSVCQYKRPAIGLIRRCACAALLLAVFPALAAPALGPTPQEADFLARHWPGDTIAPQGVPPESYSSLEASLSAVDCGVCHPRQFQDWQTSLHSRAMGPGVAGQTVDMRKHDPAGARMCWRCHAPLAEQQPLLQQPADGRWVANPAFDAGLQQQGLTCAACHVRAHRRFGPPARTQGESLAHAGFSVQTAFGKSAFCAHCHQFPPGEYALNGKLMENTYNEWLASDYARQGVQCQDCHMPDRRHLWRGIHDPAMVKKAVTITVSGAQNPLRVGDMLEASIRVLNSGTGHYFPTYVTPKVFVRAQLLGAAGEAVSGSLREAIIGRETTPDLSREIYDTRIAPGDFVDISYAQPLPRPGLQLWIEVRVEPDHFYERFYRGLLQNGAPQQGRAAIEQALANAQQSSFVIFERTLPLDIRPRQ